MTPLKDLARLKPEVFETKPVLKKLASASRRLAELKGVAASIPNQGILINALTMQEAKDSSAIENIVTTHDELFRGVAFPEEDKNLANKEVRDYIEALRIGFGLVTKTHLLTLNHIIAIQAVLEHTNAGFRKLPGTTLKNSRGEVVYTPPQHPQVIESLMGDIEKFINDDSRFDADPLIKMAIIHHQFESIHPFYDGNGRTGRIINVLYLVQKQLLDIPVLYLSRHIVETKSEYYRLLQKIRDSEDSQEAWEEWVLYMLTAVERTAQQTISTIEAIKLALMRYKHEIRLRHKKLYSQDLINHLFARPYTKIALLSEAINVSRITATNYLQALVAGGFLEKKTKGRTNYYINRAMVDILTKVDSPAEAAKLVKAS
jgi:Fic family protein